MNTYITLLVLVLTLGPIFTAYLIGSIPTSVWISKWIYGIDIRDFGSKNAGATNALRVLGKTAAIPILIIDILKGIVVTFLSHYTIIADDTQTICILGFAAIIGHIFPLFAGFRGGKGVATMMGVCIGLFPLATTLSILVFLIAVLFNRMVSLSVIIASISLPIIVYLVSSNQTLFEFSISIPFIILITHHNNIKRIINKTEPKFTLI